MIERIGTEDVLVKNYTNNFDIKDFIQRELLPKAFPSIPLNQLNLGFTGLISEYQGQAMEDVYASAALMMNESFITRAVLPLSIYSEAALFGLGYTFAKPSKAEFLLQVLMEDLVKYSSTLKDQRTKRFVIDKNTRLRYGDNSYRLDYDIFIDHQLIDGRRAFKVYYDDTEPSSVAIVDNVHIKHQVTTAPGEWLALFIQPQEIERKIIEEAVTDNIITVNSDMFLKWSKQIAGLDLVYITPRGDRLPMKLKVQYTKPEHDPFVWYRFHDENTIRLVFSAARGFWQPEFNSRIEATIYTTHGEAGNFDLYNPRNTVPVYRTGERFEYNANTKMVAWCYQGSSGGLNRGDTELLRNDVILAHNTVNVLTTENDMMLWFDNYAQRHNSKSYFFKRRDDPTGRLFSQFVAIVDNTYVYPTNTLGLELKQIQSRDDNTHELQYDTNGLPIWERADFDFINPGMVRSLDALGNPEFDGDGNPLYQHEMEEFIIKPGHLWEYKREQKTDALGNPLYNEDGNPEYYESRHTVVMVRDPLTDNPVFVTDDVIPPLTENRPFMFINPFYLRLHRNPTLSATYNNMIDHTSWPSEIPVDSPLFYSFQLGTFRIERYISKEYDNMYRIGVVVIPTTTHETLQYVRGIGEMEMEPWEEMIPNPQQRPHQYIQNSVRRPEPLVPMIDPGTNEYPPLPEYDEHMNPITFTIGSDEYRNWLRSPQGQTWIHEHGVPNPAHDAWQSMVPNPAFGNWEPMIHNPAPRPGRDYYTPNHNNLRVLLLMRTRRHGVTGFIEMEPTEARPGGAYVFETRVAVHDNLNEHMELQVDIERTRNHGSVKAGNYKPIIRPYPGEDTNIYIDSAETSFHFATLVKDPMNLSGEMPYDEPTLENYHITNKFANLHRDLTLYQSMKMMRSTLIFTGNDADLGVSASLVPLLKYDIALDKNIERMMYFVRAFNNQYQAIESVINRLDGNTFLDFKLFNTYGRSNNYFIGPIFEDVYDDSDPPEVIDSKPLPLHESEILLDDVHVKVRFKMAVYDRSSYAQTCEAVMDEIESFFESLNTGQLRDMHVSQLINQIKQNHPNVNYLIFLGFNEYDALKQSIFVKYDDISELRQDQLEIYVPEMIRVNRECITITEQI